MIDFPSTASGGGGGGTSSQVANMSSNLGGTNLTTSMLNSFRAGSFGAVGSGGGSAGQNIPPSFDLNEFPSLGGGASINNFSSSSSTGRPAYVGMVKEAVVGGVGGPGGPIGGPIGGAHQLNAEFNIQTEDFPALPGSGPMTAAQAAAAAAAASSTPTSNNSTLQFGNFSASAGGDIESLTNGGGSIGVDANGSGLRSTSPSKKAGSGSTTTNIAPSYSIQFTKDGHPLNAPAGLLSDPFGIVGFVHLLQTLDSNPNLRNLMLGYEPSSINLNLKSKERIYQSYGGPWCDRSLRPYEIDYPVPQEYFVYGHIKEKLAPFDFKNAPEDTLFFLFYFFAGEEMQQFAANELYKRDWRFHKEERTWICRRPGAHLEKQATYERGSYIYFDPINWLRNQKDMLVEYEKLETIPEGLMQNS